MQIAKNGLGATMPNPSVGAVIVYDNVIIGEGFTSNYGGNHAEVNAINSVKNKKLLTDATVYVTLEPCSHFGKTPPCANLLIKHKVKNVVIGCLDSNNLVAGKGVERLKKAGINVTVGVLEQKCKEHHKRFFTYQEKNRPYIILKWAQTIDNFIAPLFKKEKKPVWISNSYSQQIVHKWRAQEHAILVGTNTVLEDNPTLNVRSWFGNNPVRVVLDRDLKISERVNIFSKNQKTIVLCSYDSKNNSKNYPSNVCIEKIDFTNTIAKQICIILYNHNIQSIIIEGGAKTLQTFIDENLWDEARVFVGDKNFINGVKSPTIKGSMVHKLKIKSDTLKIYKND